MKVQILITLIVIILGCSGNHSDNKTNVSVENKIKSSKYIDSGLPGLKPELFAPNIISTGMAEINAVFSPDFKEFYYSIRMPDYQLVIMELKFNGKQWSEPEVCEFSGKYSDADPFISYDGKWMYFISKRPVDSTFTPKSDWDIWRMEKVNGKWSDPKWLGENINSKADDLYPSLTRDGTMYFSSGRLNDNRDIYYSKQVDNSFAPPVRLTDTINSFWEGDVFISPDEDYIIFASYGRPEGNGLFISFNEGGHWKTPKNMGKKINIQGGEWCPILSPDGKYFFFTSVYRKERAGNQERLSYKKIKNIYNNSYRTPQMGNSDVYWIDATIINEFR